ncbi:MAG: MFS transporter [Rhodospirillales bacterium]
MTKLQGRDGGTIVALIGGVLIYGLAMGTTYPLLGLQLAEQVSGVWNGLNAAATGLGLLLGVVLVPPLARRLGAGRVALAGVTTMALALAALAMSENFWAIFAARLALGCGANCLFVVAETALNGLAAPSRRGRIMGAYTAAIAVGFVAGPAVVAVAADRPALLLLACAGVTLLALLPLRLARGPVDLNVRPTPLGRILPAVSAYPFAFGFLFVASAVDAVAISLLPLIALERAFSAEAGALFVTLFHVGLLIGQPLVGAALDVLGRRRTVLICCLLSLACTLALALGAQLGFWPVALLLLVWGGANFGLYTAGLALIGDRFAGAALTAATAAFAAVYASASIVSPILAGATVDSLGATGFYAAVAGLYLAVLFCGGAFFRPPEPSLAPS